MRCTSLTEAQQRTLLRIARAAIAHGCEHGRPLPVAAADHEPALREPRASFVTLKLQGQLRGCIGSLEARRALVEDVAENAYAAAFRDPRFAPLSSGELAAVDISLSLLTRPEPMQFADEADLLDQLRPGEDGLVLRDQGRRSTFLPAVWQSLPEPARFLRELKRKAGLSPNHWSASIEFERYQAEHIEEGGRPVEA